MESVRRHIESQVLSLTGLAVGGVDFESPKGDPGLFGPDAACWKVHGDFSSMMIGGIGALLLQMLHPLALAGVWDHSNFRDDLLGRLRRTRPPPTAGWPMPSDGSSGSGASTKASLASCPTARPTPPATRTC